MSKFLRLLVNLKWKKEGNRKFHLFSEIRLPGKLKIEWWQRCATRATCNSHNLVSAIYFHNRA